VSALNLAFRSLAKRRLRTGLTVSGIVVGVAMIAAMTISNKASLYTFDIKHFKPIKALGLLDFIC